MTDDEAVFYGAGEPFADWDDTRTPSWHEAALINHEHEEERRWADQARRAHLAHRKARP